MTRVLSFSRRLVGEDIEVNVSTRRVLVENRQDNLHTRFSPDDTVSFRIKPDRRSVDIVMPAGSDRRRS